MAAPPVGIGDVIAGKYIVENVIGEGGMGVVFSARHRELDQRVAIKFLLSEFAEQGMAAERFRREARSAAKMRGEHVCRVLDVGTLDNGVPFMVMEFLDGRDLSSELERRGRLPAEEAVGYVLEACEALAEAHVAGIVHRDLKPANLFLETRADGSRRIKVLDFGVSKSLLELGSGQGALTKTSSLVGSPLYMSPEQLDSAKDVDGRTDVWSLGVVLYELVTGNTPFRGETIPQLVAAVLQDTPVQLTTLSQQVPNGLSDVVKRSLAKARAQRFGSVVDFAQALAPFGPPGSRLSVLRASRMRVRDAAASNPLPEGVQGHAPTEATSRPSRPSRPSATPLTWVRNKNAPAARWLWAAGVLALLVVGAASVYVLQGRSTRVTERVAQPPAAATTLAPVAPPPIAAPAVAPNANAAARMPSGDEPATLKPVLSDEATDRPQEKAAMRAAAAGTGPETLAPKLPGETATTGMIDKPAPVNAQPVVVAPPPTAAPARPRPAAELDPKRNLAVPSTGSSISDFGGRR